MPAHLGKNPMPQIVVVGSVNADFIIQTPALPLPNETIIGSGSSIAIGGKGFNQAIAASRMGIDVHMLAAVGGDVFGSQARSLLQDNQVDVSYVQILEGESTGMANIVVAPDGQNTIVVSPGANALLTSEIVEAAEEVIAAAALLIVQLETPLQTVRRALEIASHYGVPTLLNPAPADVEALSLMSLVSFVTPNETELAKLSGIPSITDETLSQGLSTLTNAGAKCAVVTLGPIGSAILMDGQIQKVPTFRVNAIDATGAGDIFTGVLASELAFGRDILIAMRFASAASALSVTRLSANSAPTRGEVEAFIQLNE